METAKSTIYQALCKAQAMFKPAMKDSTNPHFKSAYADLSSIWEACREGLAANSLFVSQFPAFENDKWLLYTKVYDENGDSISCAIPILCAQPNAPQAFGSAMTYARRYSLAAILGIITDDDDDANAASPARNQQPQQYKKPVPGVATPAPIIAVVDDELIFEILDMIEVSRSREEVTAIWKQYPQFHKHAGFIAAVKKASLKFPKEENAPAQ